MTSSFRGFQPLRHLYLLSEQDRANELAPMVSQMVKAARTNMRQVPDRKSVPQLDASSPGWYTVGLYIGE